MQAGHSSTLGYRTMCLLYDDQDDLTGYHEDQSTILQHEGVHSK